MISNTSLALKTIATFSKPEEAHLLRMRLEAAEIPAFVQDENIVQLNWLFSNVIGGVRVQVADADLAGAEEFLLADRPDSSGIESEVICPSCGSSETSPDELPRRIAFLALLFVHFPLLLWRGYWRCAKCGIAFKPKRIDAVESHSGD